MRFKSALCVGIFFLLSQVQSVEAEKFIVVENDFHWYSSNLTEVPVDQIYTIQVKKNYLAAYHTPLGHMAYNKHFDTFGAPPPLNFLRPLKKGSALAKIEGKYVVFTKSGSKIPLNSSIVPAGADAANPYLLSIPNLDRVLVAYPYYLFQDKDNVCITEMYSGSGALLTTFSTVPTHVSAKNPSLLIAPEKSGCCDSLVWSIRFYDLYQGSVSEYTCPEGFCGDVLFTKLAKDGPFFIAQEIVGNAGEIGSSLQTNIYIVENDGALSASGKIIHAIHDPNISKHMMQAVSPYAVSNLVAVDQLPEKNSWLLRFGVDGKEKTLKLVSIYKDPAPSVVFFLSQDPSSYNKKGLVKMAKKTLGSLPLLGIVEPGQHTFTVFFDDGTEGTTVANLESDRVNIVIF